MPGERREPHLRAGVTRQLVTPSLTVTWCEGGGVGTVGSLRRLQQPAPSGGPTDV